MINNKYLLEKEILNNYKKKREMIKLLITFVNCHTNINSDLDEIITQHNQLSIKLLNKIRRELEKIETLYLNKNEHEKKEEMNSFLYYVSNNNKTIEFIQKIFNNRIGKKPTIILITKLLNEEQTINLKDFVGEKYKRFLNYNKSKFDKNNNLKKDKQIELYYLLIGFININYF